MKSEYKWGIKMILENCSFDNSIGLEKGMYNQVLRNDGMSVIYFKICQSIIIDECS